MKSGHRILLLLLFSTVFPSSMGAFSMASLPYPFNTWHANARTFAQKQEDIRAYHLTVKIKRRTKTIKKQSFTAFDYTSLISKALKYAQKEQLPNLKSVFKPSIRLTNWNIYALGNLVLKTLPTNPAAQVRYWKDAEKNLADSFYVSPPQQNKLLIPLKIVTTLGIIPLTLLFCLGIFLLGLICLYYASRKKI